MLIRSPQSEITTDMLVAAFRQELDANAGMIIQPMVFEIDEASVNPEKRTVSGVASTETISRSGHMFRIDGIHLEHYHKNPVALAAHWQYAPATLLPAAIGTVGECVARGKSLLFNQMTFDDDPLSEAWWQKVKRRIVRMVSIGAWPIEWDLAEVEVGKGKDAKVVHYIDIIESELLEISVCAVGANRGAFFKPKSIGQADDNGRLAELESRISQLTATVESLSSSGSGKSVDGDLPDAAFVVELGAPKSDDQPVPAARHLPHHWSSVQNGMEHSTVNLPLLRSALIQVNSVEPRSGSTEEFRELARKHLMDHATAILKTGQADLQELQEQVQRMVDNDPTGLIAATSQLIGIG